MKAKKHFGQHFLTSNTTAQSIVDGLGDISTQDVLEVGPGMGIITQFMLSEAKRFRAVEIDHPKNTITKKYFIFHIFRFLKKICFRNIRKGCSISC